MQFEYYEKNTWKTEPDLRTRVLFSLPDEKQLREQVREAADTYRNQVLKRNHGEQISDDTLVLVGHVDEALILHGLAVQQHFNAVYRPATNRGAPIKPKEKYL